MKNEKNFKISLEELSSKVREIIAQRSEISLAKALDGYSGHAHPTVRDFDPLIKRTLIDPVFRG